MFVAKGPQQIRQQLFVVAERGLQVAGLVSSARQLGPAQQGFRVVRAA